MGTGVSPATGFLKESGFSLEKDGGIAVDEQLRVKGERNIYAIGDIAHYSQYPDKFQRRVEHWNVAGNMVCIPAALSSSSWSTGLTRFRDVMLVRTSPSQMTRPRTTRSQFSGRQSERDYDTSVRALVSTTPTPTVTSTSSRYV